MHKNSNSPLNSNSSLHLPKSTHLMFVSFNNLEPISMIFLANYILKVSDSKTMHNFPT